MDQRHIHGKVAILEQERNLGEEARSEIRPSLVHGQTNIIADKKSVHTYVTRHPGCDVVRFPYREHLNNFHVTKRLGMHHKCGHDFLWNRGVPGQEHTAARLNRQDGIFRRHCAFAEKIQPAHSATPFMPR